VKGDTDRGPAPILSRRLHGHMNGSRAGTADRARAADIVNAEPPPDERADSIGPQARYRRPGAGDGLDEGRSPDGRVHHLGARARIQR